MEAHIQTDEDDEITTSWNALRASPRSDESEFNYIDMGDITNTSIHTQFYATLAESVYTGNLEYFQSPLDLDPDRVSVGNNNVILFPNSNHNACVYRNEVVNGFDNMTIYIPMIDNVNPAPIYIIFRGTDSLFDIYKDISVAYDYLTSQPLGTIDSEVNHIVNSITGLLATENRPVFLIGHSLGGLHALKVLQKLRERESPNFDTIESSFKAILFNPLLVFDETIHHFRTTDLGFAKGGGVEIHSVIGDFLSPLLFRSGVGKVYAYNKDPPTSLTSTSFELADYLASLVGVETREQYLSYVNHRIDNFRGSNPSPNVLQPYALVQPLVLPQTVSLRTKLTREIGQYFEPHGTTLPHHLYMWNDTNNLDSSKQYLDYPHDSSITNDFNWSIHQYSPTFILSTWNGVNYINFQLNMRPISETSKFLYRYLMKVGDNEYLLGYSLTELFKLNNTVPLPLPSELLLDNKSTYDGLSDGNHKDRFIFKLNPMVVDGAFYDSQRRSLTVIPEPPPSNPWSSDTNNIHYAMWEQNLQPAGVTRGYFGYVRISNQYMNITYPAASPGTNDTYAFLEYAGTAWNTYLSRSPTWQGSNNIDWNDNNPTGITSSNPPSDEHIWKIQHLGDDANGNAIFTILNTDEGVGEAKPFVENYFAPTDGSFYKLVADHGRCNIDYSRNDNNHTPARKLYHITSTHLPWGTGRVYARQFDYQENYHGGYGQAFIDTGHENPRSNNDDTTREEWFFEFI